LPYITVNIHGLTRKMCVLCVTSWKLCVHTFSIGRAQDACGIAHYSAATSRMRIKLKPIITTFQSTIGDSAGIFCLFYIYVHQIEYRHYLFAKNELLPIILKGTPTRSQEYLNIYGF